MVKNLQRSKIIEDGERGFASLFLVSELQASNSGLISLVELLSFH